ncbi:MAG: RelA/SpoT domain-containing protein [Planctomycetaceae bacterium]|nr:RelA/SpoT domain-containing protein [Planctomycetaceae bacterium]
MANDIYHKISKRIVDKAGDVLRNEPQNEEALEVLDTWRTMHAAPLQKAVAVISELYQESTTSPSSRLKRSVSIIEKLERMPEMKLSRMQDIAGVRLVEAGFFNRGLLSAFHVLREYSYREKPKASGYSAHHLVLSLNGDCYKDFQIELQFRTYLEHLWAMAVETVGMFYGEALKASQGNEDWLEFFKLASAALSHIERRTIIAEYANKGIEDIRNELREWGLKKTFFSKLSAIKEVGERTPEKKYDYWLLELNIKKSENRIYGFVSNQLETATAMYAAKERTPACLRGDVQVVLVSTQRFKDLRAAYPSYFLDVAEFVRVLNDFCGQ